MDQLLDYFGTLGDDIRLRPQPSPRGGIAAFGGAIASAGLAGLIIGEEAPDRLLITIIGVVILACGYVYSQFTPEIWRREAGTVAAAIGAGVAVVGAVGPGGSANVIYFLWAVAFTVLWCAPATKGRPILLGAALLSIWLLLVVGEPGLEVVDNTITEDSLSGSANDFREEISLLLGVIYLGIGFALDRKDLHGILTTPFFAIGNVSFWIGSIVEIQKLDDPTSAGFLVLLAGLAVAYLGSRGDDRRFTTWTGALGVGTGIIMIYGDQVGEQTQSVRPASIVLLLLGAAIVAAVSLIPALSTIGKPKDEVIKETSTTSTDSAAPGWYPDPQGSGMKRYWDGQAWTEHTQP